MAEAPLERRAKGFARWIEHSGELKERFEIAIVDPVLCQNSALLKDHGCNLMHRKVLASFYQHLMAEAPMRSV